MTETPPKNHFSVSTTENQKPMPPKQAEMGQAEMGQAEMGQALKEASMKHL